jgi:hypothetical protein
MRQLLQPAFARIEPALVAVYRYLSEPPKPNLWGDRHVEYSWVAGQLPEGPGRGLDLGSGESHLSLAAVHRGFDMLVTDRSPIEWPFEHPGFTFVQGDAQTAA